MLGDLQDFNLTVLNNDSLVEAQQLLNLNNPANVWAVMTEVHDTAAEIADLLSMVDWQMFMPVESEEVMERRAVDYEW